VGDNDLVVPPAQAEELAGAASQCHAARLSPASGTSAHEEAPEFCRGDHGIADSSSSKNCHVCAKRQQLLFCKAK
jgi:hypothetical protein